MKKILLLHDLCTAGKAAMGNIVPVLNALGTEVWPIPTVLLSTHTGGFGSPVICQIPKKYMIESARHLQKQGFRPDVLFIGYLGNDEAIETAEEIQQIFSEAPVFFDPIFGDNGKYYSNFDSSYMEKLKSLLNSTTLLLPNLTEICCLAGISYEEAQNKFPESELIAFLNKYEIKKTVVTDIPCKIPSEGKNGIWVYENGSGVQLEIDVHPEHFHGAGDLFDGVVVGELMNGKTLKQAALRGHAFVSECICRAIEKEISERNGLPFEEVLNQLF